MACESWLTLSMLERVEQSSSIAECDQCPRRKSHQIHAKKLRRFGFSCA
jgi:hypothetical protein